MAIGQITSLDNSGSVPLAPTFSDRIKFAGDGAYPAGGTVGFQALFNKITGDNRKPIAVIAQDCGGYQVSYNEVAGSALAAAGTYALVDGQTITVTLDGPVSASSGTFPPGITMILKAYMFANIAAATAAEVVAALNTFFNSFATQDPQQPPAPPAVASVSGGNRVLITSATVGVGSQVKVAGSSSAAFTWVSTAGTDKLKVWTSNGAAPNPLLENTTADLSGTTFNVLVISK